MNTIEKQYTLSEAFGALKQNAELFDWKIVGDLPSEVTSFDSRNQEKKYLKAVNRLAKKSTRRTANRLFYIISSITGDKKVRVNLGDKELAIQSKRKAWLTLRDLADGALKEYNEEKGDFYKDILNKL
jgi:hypothetical protein